MNVIKKFNKIKNNKAFNIGFMVIKAFSALLIAVVVCIIFVQRISDNKINLGGYGMFTVITASMAPEYNVWDMVISKKIDPNDIKIGDDVVYQGKVDDFAGKIVTHRVINIDEKDGQRTFTTKGIANPIEDPKITGDQIYGKVTFKSEILSFLSKIINNIYGFYFIVFVPFVIMVFFEIIDVINDREKRKKRG